VAFSSLRKYGYTVGDLYLGVSPTLRRPVGVTTERHALTVAGAGAGKGACLIIPNLRRWPGNALVIDPKGEAAAETWQARQMKGQAVHVIDPFRAANVPEKVRAKFNPLSLVDPSSPTAREQILAIAEGLITRHNPTHAQWDNTAKAILAGLIAFNIADAPEEFRTLQKVRAKLMQERDPIYKDAQKMQARQEFGGLARAAGTIIVAAIDQGKGLEAQGLEQARAVTSWIDADPLADLMGESSFDLRDIKSGHTTVFLVLPPAMVDTYPTFFRLFILMALNVMGEMDGSGNLRDRQCLFVLDEFKTLGKLESVSNAAGLMRGWGVQLWPILQDLGQLIDIYGREGAETFMGNSDVISFFGNTDPLTLEYISRMIGNRTDDGAWGKDEKLRGQPLMSPQEVREFVKKGQGDKVARRMIVFSQGGDVLAVKPRGFFDEK
jgi:type IV secretory pathway TraG/TraD family ATPase VirD4